jgi:hypothetical protein
MQNLWERLTTSRSAPDKAVDVQLAAGDRVGAELYLQFNDCLESNKYRVFAGGFRLIHRLGLSHRAGQGRNGSAARLLE